MPAEDRPDPRRLEDRDYRRLVESITDCAIYMLDPHGRVTSWNTGAERIKGWSAAEVIGGHFARFYTEADRAAGEPERVLASARRDGRFETTAWRVRRDGSRFRANVVVEPIRAEDGTLVGYAKISRDVTEAKQAQEALVEAHEALQAQVAAAARSEARFRQVVEANPGAIVMVNAAGRIELVNAATDRLFGYPRAELLGQTVEMLLPPRLRDRHAGLRTGFRAAPEPRAMGDGGPLHGRRHDGSEFEVEVFLSALDSESGPMVLAVIADISDRVRLEAQLRQAQKMEVLGRLAAGVSHDFNNILQVILGGVDLLKDESSLSPVGHTFVDMAKGAARRGAYLTHHLLAYSRQQTLTPKSIDLNDTLEKLRFVLSRTLASNIAVSTQVAPGIGRVRADGGQLETALMNLAINAAYAMPDGGSLRFEIAPAEGAPFGELAPGRYIMIAVTDTGTGMAPEVLACAFDPFFTTKGLEGTGLGLAMVQGFSRQSGGDVRAISEVGHGTRFEIWLPEEAGRVAAAAAARGRGRLQTGHLLLVDDSRDVLVMMEAFLRKAGYTVQHAGNGTQALALLKEGARFDAIVTDYMMSGLNGAELVRRARDIHPGLPALVISGYAEVSDFMADLPNAALLLKPFDREELTAQVSALIAGAPQLAEAAGLAE